MKTYISGNQLSMVGKAKEIRAALWTLTARHKTLKELLNHHQPRRH